MVEYKAIPNDIVMQNQLKEWVEFGSEAAKVCIDSGS